MSQLSGRDWARAVERVSNQVIESCATLDPPSRGPVRGSDGRSIWIPPCEPHLTHEAVLAQEERILTFAMDAHDRPEAPSHTVERAGLDVLQADTAAAVAGHDRLVLVVGPAGAGKTTALRQAVEDLARQRRTVFGVAPTAKAAKVLREETGMPADTIAKLLHEWRTERPRAEYALEPGTTLVVDEAGMCGTGALDELITRAVSQQWRLVLVGDPRQLQAVGRGGMFDELCRVGRTHELATIHRFRHGWEQRASLQLRAGSADALDAYFGHRRITPGTFDDVTNAIALRWIGDTAAGRAVAVVAETNEHVDALNAAIQQARREAGHLGHRTARVSEGETAAVGDIVVTRRNDRALRTDHDEPVRNRDRWQVTAVNADGTLTVSHLGRHGRATLPADYTRRQVRLGYAATAHGHQGDTVDVSLMVVTEATTHRSLYVGATRGRDENRLFVVTDEPDAARDVLERVLTNDRADLPAIAQRRNLARQVPHLDAAMHRAADAQQQLRDTKRAAEPYLAPLRQAETILGDAKRRVARLQWELDGAPLWRRRGIRTDLARATAAQTAAEQEAERHRDRAAPHAERVAAAETRLAAADRELSAARLSDQMDRFAERARTRTIDRGIDPPGL